MVELTTTAAVIEELGGTQAVAELTSRKYTAAWNWTKAATFPPNTFFVMTQALRERGKSAPASLWGMTEPKPASASAEATAQ